MRVRRRGGDRESGASAIELVVWTPVLFVVMFVAVQYGLYLFAQHVAVSAAQEGAREARESVYPDEQNGTDWVGPSTGYARQWVQSLVGNMISGGLPDPTPLPASDYVDFADTANPEVGVSVTFSIVSVVPFVPLNVSASSQGPVECFYDNTGHCVGN